MRDCVIRRFYQLLLSLSFFMIFMSFVSSFSGF
jgi:hypothetical protein